MVYLVKVTNLTTGILVVSQFVETVEEANAIVDDPQYVGPMFRREVISINDMAVFIKSLKKSLKAAAERKYQSNIEEKYTIAEIASLTALQAEKANKFTNMKTYILPFYDAMIAKKQEIDACTTYEQLMAIVI